MWWLSQWRVRVGTHLFNINANDSAGGGCSGFLAYKVSKLFHVGKGLVNGNSLICHGAKGTRRETVCMRTFEEIYCGTCA